MKLFAVYDIKAKLYGPPQGQQSEVQAIRSMAAEVNRPDPHNALYTHPEDFQLVLIGHYDENTGNIDADHAVLAEATALIKKEPK